VESVLLDMKETSPHYLLVVDRVNNLDVLELQVEVEEGFFHDRISELQGLTHRIRHAMESTLGISLTVKLVEPKTIARSEGKAVRVIDRRTWQ
jgi:phenylacetate-CoA ligase